MRFPAAQKARPRRRRLPPDLGSAAGSRRRCQRAQPPLGNFLLPTANDTLVSACVTAQGWLYVAARH